MAKFLERYIGDQCIHPAIAATGRSTQYNARPGIPLHSHACHEICLVSGGSVLWRLDGTEYRVEPGYVFFTRPEQVHGSAVAIVEPCTLTWIQVIVDVLEDSALRAEVAAISDPLFPATSELYQHLRSIHGELRHPARHSGRVVHAELILFLTKTVGAYRRHFQVPVSSRPFPSVLDELCRFVENQSDRALSVNDLVKYSGLSRSRVHSLFRTYLAQAPRDYIAEHRMQKGRELLCTTTRTITDIATTLEFSSSQHFATAFRRRYGMTPGDYRASHENS